MTNESTDHDKIAEFEICCRDHGLPLTLQRRAILRNLAGRYDHPTADQVFETVSALHSGISRTTVYRVLETLVQLGVARKVCSPGSSARFDADTKRHHHVVCTGCNQVMDFTHDNLDHIDLPEELEDGFSVLDYSLTVTGLCAACRNEKTTQSSNGRSSGRTTTPRRHQ